ncbi:MAG: cytochrome C oxidase subunit II [Sulfurimonas sp.]|uniref:cytochrome C oxidase subunit II n=1 Tax=Sulfurimonas sp. TaxID=2022749 RepID=UPI00262211FB|nr:cytochrome C oxidase subunit II [Sulfurimonas sp.]MCW8895830.1 cytochrome C oxidase subunit II [Sulfurimonas sp.]MCW8954900.1 cytochrome C oxidase subunit II [Sulfurimonas sp.]
MADSVDVLSTLKLVYTIYALAAISLIGWYAYRITQDGESKKVVKPVYFWSYVSVLVVIGTGLHFLTFNVVPWVPIDLDRANIKSEKTFKITYENHKIVLEEPQLQVPCNEYVVFDAYSNDLTYGFGIFRQDHTMVTQMQVVADNRNDLMWKFLKNGTYYIRSTEYSGPKGTQMIIEDAIVVSGCQEDDIRSMK